MCNYNQRIQLGSLWLWHLGLFLNLIKADKADHVKDLWFQSHAKPSSVPTEVKTEHKKTWNKHLKRKEGSCHFQAKLLREITDIVTMKNCPNPKQQIYQLYRNCLLKSIIRVIGTFFLFLKTQWWHWLSSGKYTFCQIWAGGAVYRQLRWIWFMVCVRTSIITAGISGRSIDLLLHFFQCPAANQDPKLVKLWHLRQILGYLRQSRREADS